MSGYSNTLQGIRDISKKVGFYVDPSWNTRTAGAKLIDYINSMPSMHDVKSEKDVDDVKRDRKEDGKNDKESKGGGCVSKFIKSAFVICILFAVAIYCAIKYLL